MKSSRKIATSEILTKREKEVSELSVKGFNRNEIANKLFVSPETIKKHFQNAFKKLKVKNKIQALNKIR